MCAFPCLCARTYVLERLIDRQSVRQMYTQPDQQSSCVIANFIKYRVLVLLLRLLSPPPLLLLLNSFKLYIGACVCVCGFCQWARTNIVDIPGRLIRGTGPE